MRRSVPLWTALVLAGCTVLDGREVSIDPGGHLATDSVLVFTPRAKGVSRVDVQIDGRSVGTFQVDEEATVPLGLLKPGLAIGDVLTLDVIARSVEPAPRASTPVTFGRFEITSISPPPGPPPSDQPLTIDVTFSLPVRADQVGPGAVLVNPPGVHVAAATPVEPNRLRITLDQSLDDVGSVALELHAIAPSGGPSRSMSLGAWTAPDLGATVTVVAPLVARAGPVPANKTVTFDVKISGPPVAGGTLRAGSLVIATLDGAGPWRIDWDVSAVPDGLYPQIEVRAPGRHVAPQGGWPGVRVDHTPPHVVGCGGLWSGTAELGASECVAVDLDEQIASGAPVLQASGVPVASTMSTTQGVAALRLVVCPSLPLPFGPVSVDLAALRDAADNPVAGSCGPLAVPAWLSPLGPGPVRAGGAEVQAALALAFTYSAPYGDLSGNRATLDWVDAGGGTTRWTNGNAAALPAATTWAPSVSSDVLEAVALASEGGRVGAVWIERNPAGDATVHGSLTSLGTFWPPGEVLSVDSGREPREPAVVVDAVTGPALGAAWTEATPAGGRVVRYSSYAPAFPPAAAPLSSGDDATTTVASSPTIIRDLDTFLSWIEDGSGVAQGLRVVKASGPGVLDLGRPAEATSVEPAPGLIDMGWPRLGVAWTAAGQLQLSTFVDFSTLTWSPTVTLNDEPAAVARWPRFFGRTSGLDPYRLAWVERGALGDRILMRVLNGGAWELYPGAANAGVVGQVTSLMVTDRLVTWTDELGRVYVRTPAR